MKAKAKTVRQVQAVVFFGKKIVLLKKRDSRFENGKWVFLEKAYWRLPKGKLEKGESSMQGLKRELHEECGFTKIFSARKVFHYDYEAPKGTLRKVDCYALRISQKPKLTANARQEGIENTALVSPSAALKKLHWQKEKKSLKAALAKEKL